MYLIFDTETTGLPPRGVPYTETDKWPRMVQIAWQLHDASGQLIEQKSFLVRPEGFNIPYEAQSQHGISTDLALAEGEDLEKVLDEFEKTLEKTGFVIGHNIGFDIGIVAAEMLRKGRSIEIITNKKTINTASDRTAALMGLSRYPKLGALYRFLFGEDFALAHNATADVEANARVFWELVRRGFFSEEELGFPPGQLEAFQAAHPDVIAPAGIEHIDFKKASELLAAKKAGEAETETEAYEAVDIRHISHLHTYSIYSILNSTIHLKDLVQTAALLEMPAVALTDQNNVMGLFRFWDLVRQHNENVPEEKKIKPVLGMEINVCENHLNKTRQDNGRPVVLLAKNLQGYRNLVKITSIANTDGFYYVPRVDMEVIRQYSEGLIMLTGWINGDVPWLLLNVGEKAAEERLMQWRDIFGDDLYLEVNNHGLDAEVIVNNTFKKWSREFDIPLIAANTVHYLHKKDAEAHEILLSIRDGKKLSDPVGTGRRFRQKLPNEEFYFKSREDMADLFATMPDAVNNIGKLLDRIENFEITRDIIMPEFDVPSEFIVEGDPKASEEKYLRHLVYQGAEKRWPDMPGKVRERLEYELGVIRDLGFAGYFLIVWDVINKAREMGVFVGAGRGSAAGSAVSYTLGITNVDPIEYDLLFERFLNPSRKSMPDIDMDFEDIGRMEVVKYVKEKYGQDKVSHIITYGIIKSKTAIRDTFRVMELPIAEADRLSKLAPNDDKFNLQILLELSLDELKKVKLKPKDAENVVILKKTVDANPQIREAIEKAAKIEGSIRQTGIHAAGFIISPVPIDEVIPVTRNNTSKNDGLDLYVTQYDKDVVENAGLIKMDFLGIKTLSIVKDALKMIKKRHGIDINPDELPFDDEVTYRLFQQGRTVGVFQFESSGMRKYLQQLKPTKFEDLVAMVALYRPGPMDKIPSFIARKHGTEPVTYDFPEMEKYLSASYGITIYQEQVMLLSQELGGFTGAEADDLRKAMGKKKKSVLDKLYPKFIKQGQERGFDKKILEKIWKEWEGFASYAFNRSHAVSYAVLSYQTGYIKANYPAEFLAASLSHHLTNRDKVTNFLEDAQKWNIKILPPDINESELDFMVNNEGNIRFGLASIKGVGTNAAEKIIEERRKNGPFKSIFDFVQRVNLFAVNRRVMEALALAGAFDTFGIERHKYMCENGSSKKFVETLLHFGQQYQRDLATRQNGLFDSFGGVEIQYPPLPKCNDEISDIELLEIEKDLLGFYVSGHPLDMFKHQMKFYAKYDLNYINAVLRALNENRDVPLRENQQEEDEDEMTDDSPEEQIIDDTDGNDKPKYVTLSESKRLVNTSIPVTGMITRSKTISTKKGTQMAFFGIEDYEGEIELTLFGEEFLQFRHYLQEKLPVAVQLKIEPYYKNPGRYSIKAVKIEMLSDVLEKHTKSLRLTLHKYNITEETPKKLKALLQKHPGKKSLEIYFRDDDMVVELALVSMNTHVDITPELLDELENLGIEYKIY